MDEPLDFAVDETTADSRSATSSSCAPLSTLPASISQQTSPEFLDGGRALLDGRTGDSWRRSEGASDLVHERRHSRFQTRFSTSLGRYWPTTITAEELERILLEVGGSDAVLLLQIAVGLALRGPFVTVTLDDLIGLMGLTPHGRKERALFRRQIWHTLKVIECLEIHGARTGAYRDPSNPHRPLDLTSHDRSLVVLGTQWPEQATLDGSGVPVTVTLGVGPWIERWRNQPQVLHRFGDVLAIAAIPHGKVAGAWARGIGLGLLHHWRTNVARHTDISRPGEHNTPCLHTLPVSRRYLADYCRPQAPLAILEDLLFGSTNPQRAREYFSEAIHYLCQQGLIAPRYREPVVEWPRKGWQHAWLDEKLDIPPGPECAAEIATLLLKTRKARQSRKRRTTQSGRSTVGI
jgi:hypothetical protein